MHLPKPQLKVLHIASFVGNLGDSAMHDGAYRTRAEDSPLAMEYTRLEVREYFHWGQKCFDRAFVDYLNTFDLAIWGGLIGYQLWRVDSATGTCFDIAPELLEQIRIPMLFYGLGCDATRGIEAEAMDKCRHFLDLASRKGWLLSLRNDGSKALLEQALGADQVSSMPVIADGALFAEPSPGRSRWLYPGQRLVAISLAGDMPDRRFGGEPDGPLAASMQSFVEGIAELTCQLTEDGTDTRVVFVPHIHSDIGLIAKVIECLPDRLRRQYVSMAPYLNGGENWGEIFDIYRQADLVIGMRFHACVVAIGKGIPTVAISTHHKVEGFFRDMESMANVVLLTDSSWKKNLAARVECLLADPARERARLNQLVAERRQGLGEFHALVSAWYTNANKNGLEQQYAPQS